MNELTEAAVALSQLVVAFVTVRATVCMLPKKLQFQ